MSLERKRKEYDTDFWKQGVYMVICKEIGGSLFMVVLFFCSFQGLSNFVQD